MQRREFLVASSFGMAGLVGRCGEAANSQGRGPSFGQARSTIFIYLTGGPSHIDMWDMKPEAPAEVRGSFQPIATSAPGIQVCEHLPHVAKQAHQLAFIRSLGQHGRGPNDHHAGRYYIMTGHAPGPSFPNTRRPRPDDWPFIGSVVTAKRRPHPTGSLTDNLVERIPLFKLLPKRDHFRVKFVRHLNVQSVCRTLSHGVSLCPFQAAGV